MGYYDPPDDEAPCGICGKYLDDRDECLCPRCPICEEQGDESCVVSHGAVNYPMNRRHLRLWCDAMVEQIAEWDQAKAWAEYDMEQERKYHDAHQVEGDVPPFDEHDDSAWQCGKDRDDR